MSATTDVHVRCEDCGADWMERPDSVMFCHCRSCDSRQVVPFNYRPPRDEAPGRGGNPPWFDPADKLGPNP